MIESVKPELKAELFARCSLLFACCSLLFARCLLLSARCSLLFARCPLLFAHCSLLSVSCSLLFARCLILFLRGEHLPIQHLWATAELLFTRVGLIYLVDEFFILSLLVLLKEMKKRGESKISSCCFYVWCQSIELGKASPRFPWVIPAMESSFSHLLRAIINYWVKSHSESC